MHHQDSTLKRADLSTLPNSWETLERIRVTLLLSHQQLADYLALTLKEYFRLRERQRPLSAINIFKLSDQLELGFAPIMEGKIDFKALAKHYFGDKDYLPEKYYVAAFSKRRSTLSILNHIEKKFGWTERAYVLRYFQLNEAVFVNPEREISFQFASDLCDYLYKYKFGEEGLSQMGVESFLSTNLDQVRKELGDCRNLGDIFVMMADELIPKYFEKNFIYQISGVKKHGCIITAKPNPEVMEMFHSKLIGNYATALAKRGIAAAWPRILGLPAALVTQEACIYHGDPEIRYRVNYELSAYQFERLKKMN